ncbi:hypothetical protein RSSE_c3037 [Ralstonia solanacearum]|nr:hypothetical protein RSSE_c3037 [Ralstonia solanacearum]
MRLAPDPPTPSGPPAPSPSAVSGAHVLTHGPRWRPTLATSSPPPRHRAAPAWARHRELSLLWCRRVHRHMANTWERAKMAPSKNPDWVQVIRP